MKATIAKNEKFETVGFEVIANGRTVFSWGVHPDPMFNFVREVNAKDWLTDIFTIVEMQRDILAEQAFIQHFFEAVADSEHIHIDAGYGVNHAKSDARIATLRARMQNIISNIM